MGSSKWVLIKIKNKWSFQPSPRLCSNIDLPHTNTSDSSCVHSLLSSICTRDLLRTEHSRQALPQTARWINSALCWGPDPPAEPHPGHGEHGGPPVPHKHHQIHQSGPQPKHSWTLTAQLRFCLYIWSGLWRTAGPALAQISPVRAYVTPCLDFISHVWQIAESTAITERERMIVLQV